MEQIKPWLPFGEQLKYWQQRGLIIDNEPQAITYLKNIGYYRLSGYSYPFRQTNSDYHNRKIDDFIEGSRFYDIKQLYMFDKKLRQLALDALERIEIALRVNIAHCLGKYDPLAHRKPQYFSSKCNHDQWMEKYESLLAKKGNPEFVEHNLSKYGDLPIWVATEIWDFGCMSISYKNMCENDKDAIAKIYHLQSGRHLQTHLHAFNVIRNIAAHHARLWNRTVTIQASLKGLREPQWRELNVQKPFVYFCLMKRMLDVICPNSTWGQRFLALLKEFPQVSNNAITLENMGVAVDLGDWRLWKEK